MGHGKPRRAVLDAGPLIHLAEIGRLRLLTVFEDLCLPHAVWLETVGHNRIFLEDLAEAPNLEQHSVSRSELEDFIEKNNLIELHLGEQECLFLCKKLDISTILTDDMAVRDAAHRLKLVPVGSLGIVVAAYKHGVISRDDAELFIADLYDISSLFITRALVELAIEKLGVHPKQ